MYRRKVKSIINLTFIYAFIEVIPLYLQINIAYRIFKRVQANPEY